MILKPKQNSQGEKSSKKLNWGISYCLLDFKAQLLTTIYLVSENDDNISNLKWKG